MNTSRKAELAASIRHIERFSISGVPIYNSEVPDTVVKETRRRRTQVIAKRRAFHANVIEEVRVVKWLSMNKTNYNQARVII